MGAPGTVPGHVTRGGCRGQVASHVGSRASGHGASRDGVRATLQLGSRGSDRIGGTPVCLAPPKAVHALTAGHRTFSVQYLHVSVHFSIRAATISEREQTESCARP